MSRYQFELAGPADDADLRDIMARTPMQGSIRVSFRREPSFFEAAVVDGQARQIVAARDLCSIRLVGFGSRSLRRVYVNGQPQTVGYLSTLRLLEAHRGIGLVARGFAFFRMLHQDGQARLYLTTIGEGNDTAQAVLLGGRAELPVYHPAGRYHTVAIPVPRHARSRPTGIDIREATRDDLPVVVEFLATVGPARQFFPCYDAGDFFTDAGAFKGMRPDDLLLAFRGRQLVGTLAGWDQQAFRQTVVEGYTGMLRWVRKLYNVWAALRRLPLLPAPGQPVRSLTAALPLVAGDDGAVFGSLVDELCNRASKGPCPYLLLGLHDADPLLDVLRSYRARWYTTQFFVASWPDGEADRQSLDGRAPYLELGSL